MDPELKKMIEEMRVLVKDNHRMLRAIRRDQWLGFIGKIVILAVVLALPIYIYIEYLKPMISSFSSAVETTSTAVTGLPASTEIEKLINLMKTTQ